jgi:Fe-S-cluster containining protein
VTACPPSCGACCDPVILGWDPAQVPDASPNAAFVKAHWTVQAVTTGYRPDGTPADIWHVACDAFDRHTRRCTAYADRPPICSMFPWYLREPAPEAAMGLPNVCAFHDDVPGRRVLPLTVLTREEACHA